MRSRLPVLRMRRRYIAFEMDSEEIVKPKDLGYRDNLLSGIAIRRQGRVCE